MSDALTVARVAKRTESDKQKRDDVQGAEALTKHRVVEGVGLVRQVKQFLPALAPFPMVAEPSPSFAHVQVLSPSTQDVASAVGWACANPQSSGLATRLERHWDLLHRTLMENACPPCPQTTGEKTCFLDGFCSCTEEGLTFKRKVKKFENYLKFVCPVGSSMKNDLVAGNLVVRVLSRPKEYEAMVVEDIGQLRDLWYHIGLMYLNPYEPTCTRVEPIGDVGETPPFHRRVYIKRMHSYVNIVKAMQPFESSDVIAARFYKLEEADRPIGTFAPHPVPVLECSGFSSSQIFWPRRAAARRAKASDVPGSEGGPGEGIPVGSLEDASDGGDEGVGGEGEGGPLDFEALLDPLLLRYDEDFELPREDEEVVPEGGVIVAAPTTPPPSGEPLGPPPLPPPPLAPFPAGARRARVREEIVVRCDGGTITYYPSNGNFEARCCPHFAERCTLTRKGGGVAASSTSAPVHRPLGFLAAWLALSGVCEDKADHKRADYVRRLRGAEEREYRYECRQKLATQLGADLLFERETPTTATGVEAEPAAVA